MPVPLLLLPCRGFSDFLRQTWWDKQIGASLKRVQTLRLQICSDRLKLFGFNTVCHILAFMIPPVDVAQNSQVVFGALMKNFHRSLLHNTARWFHVFHQRQETQGLAGSTHPRTMF